MDRVSDISRVVDAIETEMRRVGYWSESEAPEPNAQILFSGMSFENWLQFEYLPKVKEACLTGNEGMLPPYKVGLAALRQYDYHSYNPVAQHLLSLCTELENLLGCSA